MWAYFNNQGQLIKSLEHGEHPAAGTTDFGIFAVFSGLEGRIGGNASATLRLYRPDLDETGYIEILMAAETREFSLMDGETAESAAPFEDGAEYVGMAFDFGAFDREGSAQEVTVLLDMPGLWRAVITLYDDGVRKVQGSLTFHVQDGAVQYDPTEIGPGQVLPFIYDELGRKLNISSGFYVKAVGSYSDIAGLEWNEGDVVYSKADKRFYEMLPEEGAPEGTLWPKDIEFRLPDVRVGGGEDESSFSVLSHVYSRNNPHEVSKSQVGLGNVLNVAQIPASEKGIANGVATLNSLGKIPSSQLPPSISGQLNYLGTLAKVGSATWQVYISQEYKDRFGIPESTTYVTLSQFSQDISSGVNSGCYLIVGNQLMPPTPLRDETVTIGTATIEGISSGDMLIYNGDGSYSKVDNSEMITGVKGAAETEYRVGNVSISPANIGLGNVLNAEQVTAAEKGEPLGVATLDENGKVPSEQLDIDLPITAEDFDIE